MTWKESLEEMTTRWSSGMGPSAWFGVEVGLLGVGLTCLLLLVRPKPAVWRVVSMAFAGGAAAWSIHLSLQQAWIADDAFISFRYARNLAEGNGLVWNLGERLEGYTNFLWTVLLALSEFLGVGSAYSSTAMTLGCLFTLAVVSTWKLGRPGWIPIAPALLVLSPAFIEFGTSGLEAGPTAMCVGFAGLFLADPRRRHLAAWWILAAALLRPDHALFFVPLGLFQLFAGRAALRHTIGAGLGFAAYWLGRWAYFGELFPNTFHTKSGAGAYWEQGRLYWAEFSLATGLWLAVPLIFAVALLLALPQRRTWRERLPKASLAFSFLGAGIFGVYVAKVGGDFMEFRFGLTSLVLFALGADALLSRLAGQRGLATVLAGLALLPLGLTPRLIDDGEKKWHLARESSFYRVKTWLPLEIDSGRWATGRSLATLPEQGAKAPPLAAGCIGMVGYLSRVPIVDRYGLTNATIARKPIRERGRPGHEKWATDAELLAEGAQWSVDSAWEEPLRSRTRFRLGTVDFWVLRHTPALTAAVSLPDPGVVLSGIRSPSQALELQPAVSLLYAELPQVLDAWRAHWNLVDARKFLASGQSVVQTPSRVTARESLKLMLQLDCPIPQRLRWTTAKGSCSAVEAHCMATGFETVVSCTGPEIVLENFVFEPLELEARLSQATPLGPEALAAVVRDQEDDGPLPGLLTRFRFDSPLELTRPEIDQSGEVFDVAHWPAQGQGIITGMHGGGFLNGYAWGDRTKGRLRITVPVTPGRQLLFSFLYAGGSACEHVSAAVRDGEREVAKACGQQDEVLRPTSIMFTPRSNRVVLEITDKDDGAWSHVLLDDVLLWVPPLTLAVGQP